MEHLKLLGVAATAMVVMLVMAASASATIITSPAGTPYTSTVSGTYETGHLTLHGPLGITIECNGGAAGTVESHGSSVTAKGKITKMEFTNCTGGYVVSVLKLGSLELHSLGNGTATVTASGSEVTVQLPMGFNCIYTTNNTDIGVVTDSSVTKGKPTIDINGTLPRTGHSAFCGSSGTLTGSAIINTPATGFID